MKSNARKLGVLLCVQAALLLVPAGASAFQKLDDVACTSGSFCLAVGGTDSEAGSTQAQARGWDGSKWSQVETPAPDGATQSGLTGVACTSTTTCVAVGDYAHEEEETTLALAMRWDGTDWDVDDLPVPSGALSTTLGEIVCTSSSACIAVGSYLDSAEARKSMAISWNGSTWSLLSVPIPSGAGLSELEGVACAASNDCVAVGSFVNSSDVTKTLAISWNGSTWSIASTPEPEGAELNQLYDVSCRPSDACTAVGTYFNATGEQMTLALRRNTSKEWSVQATPNQSGALSNKLTAVSCPTNTACTALGMIEQGSKDLPLAVSWNGTSWSQQSIDTEALGASSIKLASLACVSTSDCKSVGAVAYGRSAADRNLAFAWNGTAWLVSEAGEYERKWLRPDASLANNQQNGVSCPEVLVCFAVGGTTSDAGVRGGQVASWKGEDWSVKAAPAPEGAEASELSAISCASATACKAVGRSADGEETDGLMVQTWNGTAWSIQSAPAPEGAKATELSAVDCYSSSACTAVGSYADEKGVRLPLALTWNGSSWSLASVPAPAEAAEGWLLGVSCTSSTWCIAVGARADAFGHEESFSVQREGSSWTERELPEIEGSPPSFLRAVSCSSASACVTVGGLQGQDGSDYLLALLWDGSEWAEAEAPTVEGSEPYVYSPEESEVEYSVISSYTSLTSISCTSVDSCVAVAGRPGNSARPPVILRFDGDSWAAEPPAEYPAGGSAFGLAAISCHSDSHCVTVGSASFGGFPVKNFTLAYEDGVWLTPYMPAPGGGLRGISCPEAERCLAVGDSISPSGDPTRAWTLQEDGWESTPTAVTSGAFLADVSCTVKDECTAIGRQDAWPFKPLAERFDGEGWSTQSIPAPSGRSSNLEAIACPTTSFCVAVGLSWPSTGSSPANALVQSWNGSTWSTASPALPEAAVSTFLSDVECTSASLCKAVGSYLNSSGVSHGLILSWNGSSWSSTSVSPTSGFDYALRGVDCTSSTACTAVGTSTEAATNIRSPLAVRWNGSTWTTQSTPLSEGATGGSLRSVDCYSSTRCVAVGSVSDAATQSPYIVGWSSGEWKLEMALQVAGSGSTALESVSCFSAADCTAVGIAQFADGPRELLVVQTEGEDPESDDPISVAGESVPKFSAEQKEAVAEILAEDPDLQAAIGAADYESRIGVWTEADEETGEIALVGAYVEILLEEKETWPERTWPAAEYEFGENGYGEGPYQEAEVEASASLIDALAVQVALDFDSEGLPVEGEIAEIAPELAGDASVTLAPESFLEYDPAVRGY